MKTLRIALFVGVWTFVIWIGLVILTSCVFGAIIDNLGLAAQRIADNYSIPIFIFSAVIAGFLGFRRKLPGTRN